MKMTAMTVTPAIAKEWLKKNTNNRAVRQGHVQYLADIMRRGEWLLSHQGIAFSTAGVLLDGQHRLLAVLEYGKPVQMMVALGADPATFMVIDDQNAKRSAADALKVPKCETGLAMLAYRLQFKRFGGAKVTNAQLAPYVRVFSALHQKLANGNDGGTRNLRNAHIRLAAILAAEHGQGYDYVKPLYHNLVYRNYAALPAVALGFIKRVDSDGFITGSTDMSMVVHARKVFIRANASRATTGVKDLPARIDAIGMEVAMVMSSYSAGGA